MDILTRKPSKTFLARLSDSEMETMKAFAKEKEISVNQVFRLLAHNLKTNSNAQYLGHRGWAERFGGN